MVDKSKYLDVVSLDEIHVPDFNTVAVLGLGRMGMEVAEFFAEKGSTVYGVDTNKSVRDSAHDGFEDVFENVSGLEGTNLDLVVELVTEDLSVKFPLHADIARIAGPETIVAVGSSTIPSRLFVSDLDRWGYKSLYENPSNVLNVHFLPDLKSRRFADLQLSTHHDENASKVMLGVAKYLAMNDIAFSVLNEESPGFIFNNLWHGIMLASMALLDEGCTPEVIDKTMVNAWGLKYGPFLGMELIGYDTLYHVFNRSVESGYLPEVPTHVINQYKTGKYGLKTRQGVYVFDSNNVDELMKHNEKLFNDDSIRVDVEVEKKLNEVLDTLATQLVEGNEKKGIAPQDPVQVLKAIKYGLPVENRAFLDSLQISVSYGLESDSIDIGTIPREYAKYNSPAQVLSARN